MKLLAHFWLWVRYNFNVVVMDCDEFGMWLYRERIKTDVNGFVGRIPANREEDLV